MFVFFFVFILADSNRVPYDLPEAESELVAGLITEYSTIYFSLILLSEYCNLIALSYILILIISSYPFLLVFILCIVCLILGSYYFIVSTSNTSINLSLDNSNIAFILLIVISFIVVN